MSGFSWHRRSVLGGLGLTAAAMALPAAAQDKPRIKLGFIGPLSGSVAQAGLGARNGFLLAIEQANARGDYPYLVEPVVLDDASDPQTGVSAALRLVNDPEVVAATGHWNSPVALATIPIFNRFQMPFIVWGAISPAITDQNLPEVTRVHPTLAAENLPLANWAASPEGLGAARIAIVADTSDYGTSNTAVFDEYFTNAGGTITSKDNFPVGTTDFRAIVTRLRNDAPDAVYFGGTIAEAGILRRQMIELGFDVPMIGISGLMDPEFIVIAGEAAEGTLAGFPSVGSSPKLDQLYADYEARGFAEPRQPNTRHTYDAAGILLRVIEENGIDDRPALAAAIRAIEYDGVLGVTTFDANGQTQVPVELEIMEVRDGAWVTNTIWK